MPDEIDRILALELEKNGRASFAELAKKLGLGLSTVARRVNRLVEDNMIKFTAIPNIYKMGYKALAIIAIDVELSKIESVANQLADRTNIYFAAMLMGRFDIIIFGYFENQEAVFSFVKDGLAKIDGVINVETFFLGETIKGYGGKFPNR